MISPSELKKLGKQISDDFVTNGTPLTNGLQKVASDHGLNKQQVYRVAESANVEAYLTLMKTAEDKYLNFDVADPLIVNADIEKTATHEPFGSLDDYETAPASSATIEDIFGLYAQTTKLASPKDLPKPSNFSEHRKEANYIEGQIEFVSNAFSEKSAEFEEAYANLYKLAKQEVLGDTPYPHVDHIIKQAAELIGNDISSVIKEKLAGIAPHKDLDKDYDTVEKCGAPNKDSKLYKNAELLEKLATEATILDIAREKLLEKRASVPEVHKYAAKSPTITFLRSFVDLLKAHKGAALFAGGLGIGHQIGKNKGRLETNKSMGSLKRTPIRTSY